jgi:hypothetical protein
MNNQLNGMSKGDKASSNQNRYNLRSKKNMGMPDVPEHPTRVEKTAKDMSDNDKDKKT